LILDFFNLRSSSKCSFSFPLKGVKYCFSFLRTFPRKQIIISRFNDEFCESLGQGFIGFLPGGIRIFFQLKYFKSVEINLFEIFLHNFFYIWKKEPIEKIEAISNCLNMIVEIRILIFEVFDISNPTLNWFKQEFHIYWLGSLLHSGKNISLDE